jgi:hypothetical protein
MHLLIAPAIGLAHTNELQDRLRRRRRVIRHRVSLPFKVVLVVSIVVPPSEWAER